MRTKLNRFVRALTCAASLALALHTDAQSKSPLPSNGTKLPALGQEAPNVQFGRAATQSEIQNAPDATTIAIARARVFPEPLHPSRMPSEQENRALLQAISTFVGRTNRDEVSPLISFLEAFPEGAWAISLRTELGCEYDRTGWYSKALDSWLAVWQERTKVGPSEALIAVHRAGSHLAHLYARLGRMSELYELLPQLDQVSPRGANAERVRSAKDGLWLMEHTPEISFRCGPLALSRIRAQENPKDAYPAAIVNSKSTTNGMSLFEVARLSAQLGMNYQMAFRAPGADFILPAVAHWKVGHYAAIFRERNGLCLAQDPTFREDTWISELALEHECSGYFLVPPGPLPHGWRSVPEREGRLVFGKGATSSSNPDATTPYDETLKSDNSERSAVAEPNHCGMASWDTHLMLVSQEVMDTPVGYRPPFGPPIFTTMRFVQRQNERFGDVIHWSHNWQGYLVDDALNPLANVYMKSEGGWLVFVPDRLDTNIFRCQMRNPGILVRTSITNYVWKFPDGTERLYSTPYIGNNGTGRYVPLTGIEDAAGNHISIGLDNFNRVETVTDPLGQVTHFFYELADPGEPYPGKAYSTGNGYYPFQITRIVDPFGRTALFQYGIAIQTVEGFCNNAKCLFYYNGYDLTNIIDVAGLSSQFTYIHDLYSGIIDSLTTPYGTTRFQWSSPGARDVVLEITDPNGDKERIEYAENQNVNVPFADVFSTVPLGMVTANRFLWSRNTYYWDKNAYIRGFATNDYSKARIYHFTHDASLTATSGLLESTKRPLENRVWFNYPGQPEPNVPGTGDLPVKTGRVFDDGSTQLEQFERNSLGNVTRSIDAIGRTLSFLYAANDVDLLEVRQTRAGKNELLLQATYDLRHLPLSIRDAAGQTTRFAYNARGELLGLTNARNETVSFSYDVNGYLLAIDGPLPGSQDQQTFSYDAAGRLRTSTDQDGYTLTTDYDSLDRVTKVTFPDGTYQEITYDRLKPGTIRDRLGRQTVFTYTTLQQIAAVKDAIGRVTRFEWCGCGELESIIDPLGRSTRWRRDIQGRVTAKEYADGSNVTFDYEQTSSRLRQIRDEQNQLTLLSYNPDDTLREKKYTNVLLPTPSVQFTYDADYLRMSTMVDANGTNIFAYYPVTGSGLGAGRLASIDGPWDSDTITFAYDELGRLTSRAINGISRSRIFDAAGRVTQMTNALGLFAFTWEGGSERLSSTAYPSGQRTEFSYLGNFQDQLLQRIRHRMPDNSILSEFTYGYNAEGGITNWTQLQSATLKTWALLYDAVDRLSSVTMTSPSTEGTFLTYGYDDADNRTVEQSNGVQRLFYHNALNQLTTVTNSVPAGIAFQRDAAHRLVSITKGTHTSELAYDGFGRRSRIIEKENGIVLTDRRYLWCGTELCEERDSAGGTVRKRFYSHGEQVLSGDAGLPAGNYFYTRDHLSSVRAMVSQSDGVVTEAAYEAYGQPRLTAGTASPVFGFCGMMNHSPSGLFLAVLREYDPGFGRWLSRDPMGEQGGLNLYEYAESNPLNRFDPLGLDDEGSRPDLLRVETGNTILDRTAARAKKLWDKVSPWKKYTKPAENVYHTVEDGIEVVNDAQKAGKLIGSDCDVGKLNDPNQNSWDSLKNKGKEGQGLFNIASKYFNKLTGKVPGLNAVTAPATELGTQVLNQGVQSMESSFQRQQALLYDRND